MNTNAQTFDMPVNKVATTKKKPKTYVPLHRCVGLSNTLFLVAFGSQ